MKKLNSFHVQMYNATKVIFLVCFKTENKVFLFKLFYIFEKTFFSACHNESGYFKVLLRGSVATWQRGSVAANKTSPYFDCGSMAVWPQKILREYHNSFKCRGQ